MTNHPTEFSERWEEIPPFKIHITSYKIFDDYHCSVDNVDPGAVIVRSQAKTREAAENMAVTRAKERLKRTNIQQI